MNPDDRDPQSNPSEAKGGFSTSAHPMGKNGTNDRQLGVVGLVYFEVFVPPDVTIEAGREVFVPEIPVGFGGALNTASVAQALGQSVVLYYPSGSGPTDVAAQAYLQQLGVASMRWESRPNTSITLVFSEGADRSLLSAANFDALTLCPALSSLNWIHVPGLNEAHALEAQLTKARSEGVIVSVSGSWAASRLDQLGAHEKLPWDLLILNEAEAKRAFPRFNTADPHSLSHSGDIVVTRGREGAIARVGDDAFSISGRSVSVTDTTGAGDAFAAGFISARLTDASVEHALEVGVATAAAQLQVVGGVAKDPALYEEAKALLC